jgi:hypothetical protein
MNGAKKKSPCSGDAESYVETAFSLKPTLNFEAHLGWSGFHPTVRAKAYAEIDQSSPAGFNFGGKLTCSWATDLSKVTFPTLYFEVGGFPVVIVPQLTVKLKASSRRVSPGRHRFPVR